MGDYPKKYAEYGADYGNTKETIRKWVKLGRDKEDLPPLDSPSAMVSWWQKYKKNKVPAGILKAARAEEAPPEFELLEFSGEPQAPASAALEIKDSAEVSATESLNEARALKDLSLENLKAALKDNKPDKAALYRQEWAETTEIIRKWEKDIWKIEEERGDVVRKELITQEIRNIADTLARAFLDEMIKVLIAANPKLSEKNARAIAIPHRDRCFANLRTEHFSLDTPEAVPA